MTEKQKSPMSSGEPKLKRRSKWFLRSVVFIFVLMLPLAGLIGHKGYKTCAQIEYSRWTACPDQPGTRLVHPRGATISPPEHVAIFSINYSKYCQSIFGFSYPEYGTYEHCPPVLGHPDLDPSRHEQTVPNPYLDTPTVQD